ARGAVVPAVQVVLQAGGIIERAARIAEEVLDGRVGLVGDVAEGVVGDVVGDARGAGVVLGQVPHGAQVVREGAPRRGSMPPMHVARSSLPAATIGGKAMWGQ